MSRHQRERPLLVHLTTTDMSLEWLLGPQLQAFSDAGFDVVGMSASGPHVDQLRAWGIGHEPIEALTRSASFVSDIRAFIQVWRRVRLLQPDILHTHNPKPGILGRVAGWLARVPLVVNTQHGLYAQPTDRRRRRWPVYAAERFAAMFSDVELVQNPEDVATLRMLKVADSKLVLLGNGVDLGRFDPDVVEAGTRERLRAEWGVGEEDVVIGTVGRLVEEKGLRELFEAIQAIVNEKVPARLVVVGPLDGDKSDALDQVELDRAVEAGVILTGRRDDMPECYGAFDIFVTASWREGFPRSALQAAAMGLPTIGTDIRGTRQVVADGLTGLLVPVRDAAGLAGAMTALVSDPARRRSMAKAARSRAQSDFDQQTVIDRTLATYRR